MRNYLFSAVAASAMLASTMASAGAFTSVGVIADVNPMANTVQLSRGNSFELPAGTDLSAFRPGQKVQISWDTQAPTSVTNGRTTVLQLKATSIERAS